MVLVDLINVISVFVSKANTGLLHPDSFIERVLQLQQNQ